MSGFWNTLKNGGFGRSGGLGGLKEEIKDRLNVTDSSSKSTSRTPKIKDIAPTTVPQPYIPTKEEKKIINRKIENLVDMVSPTTADKLKKINEKAENLEDTIENFFDANTPINVAKRLLTEEKDLCTGDHLYVQRAGYTHHGLYVGNNQVIHYVLEGGIVKVSLKQFAAGANVHIKNSPKIYTSNQILTRAYSRLGEDGYNLFHNNCENFVNWCRNGS